MNDNILFSSFMMLNEHLYDVFVQYIMNGRTRAPPETELIEMVHTFQFGAKRDRRALQSKFKSWAKRMNFENGSLVLANTGKIIIPQEICDELIMHLHSDEHIDIENIINQIRATYTWTRRNFGMDRDVVVESIMRNCKKEECIKKMRLEIAKLGNSFCSGMPDIPVTGMFPFGMPPPLPYFPPYHCPLPFPIKPVFPQSKFPFLLPFLENVHSPGNLAIAINGGKENKGMSKRKRLSKICRSAKENSMPVAHSSTSGTNIAEKADPGKFRQPKNIHQYKALMKAVLKNPREFPEVLRSEKCQFLSTLGLAPKSICSSRTLKKFRKQLKHKQFMTRDCMIYRDRKMLRDKNKLKKCVDQKNQHNYLGLNFSKKSMLKQSETEILASKQSQFLKIKRKLNYQQVNPGPSTKTIKLSGDEKKKLIELINIGSSDEESFEKYAFQPVKKRAQEEVVKTEDKNIKEDFDDQHFEAAENPCDVNTDIENLDKKDNLNQQEEIKTRCSENLDEGREDLEKEIEDCGVETSQNKPITPQKLHKGILEGDIHHVQLKNPTDYSSSKLSSESSNLSKERQPTETNSTGRLPPQLNLTQTVVRNATPLPLQPSTTFVASGQNNNVRFVYPVKLTKAMPSNIVLINREQRGAYFVIPTPSKSILSQNNIRIQPQGHFSSSVASSTSSSHLRQLKPKPKENENTGNHGDASKIDINREMNRIAAWIYRMKSMLNPCSLSNPNEKSVKKLVSQLDIGICLVRKAKKSLKDIESVLDASESSKEVSE